MSRTRSSFLLAAALLGTLFQAGAAVATQSSDVETASASARIILPITLLKTADLNFGDIVPSGTDGEVTISTGGNRSTQNGHPYFGSASTVSAAAFTVGGQPNATYSITLPANGTVSLGNGSTTMAVNGFISEPSGTGTLSGTGTDDLTVGATLSVGALQDTGAYSGTFDVTVAYN